MSATNVDKLYLGEILLCGGALVDTDNRGKYNLSSTLVTNYNSVIYNQYFVDNIDIALNATSIFDQLQVYDATVE